MVELLLLFVILPPLTVFVLVSETLLGLWSWLRRPYVKPFSVTYKNPHRKRG